MRSFFKSAVARVRAASVAALCLVVTALPVVLPDSAEAEQPFLEIGTITLGAFTWTNSSPGTIKEVYQVEVRNVLPASAVTGTFTSVTKGWTNVLSSAVIPASGYYTTVPLTNQFVYQDGKIVGSGIGTNGGYYAVRGKQWP